VKSDHLSVGQACNIAIPKTRILQKRMPDTIFAFAVTLIRDKPGPVRL
jgi:hypothetical protein